MAARDQCGEGDQRTAAPVESGSRPDAAPGVTGAAIFPNTLVRGPDLFQTIADFPFDERKRARKALPHNLVEVCVLDGVDDITECVIRMESRRGESK